MNFQFQLPWNLAVGPPLDFQEREKQVLKIYDGNIQEKIPDYRSILQLPAGIALNPEDSNTCEKLSRELSGLVQGINDLLLNSADSAQRDVLVSQASMMIEILKERIESFSRKNTSRETHEELRRKGGDAGLGGSIVDAETPDGPRNVSERGGSEQNESIGVDTSDQTSDGESARSFGSSSKFAIHIDAESETNGHDSNQQKAKTANISVAHFAGETSSASLNPERLNDQTQFLEEDLFSKRASVLSKIISLLELNDGTPPICSRDESSPSFADVEL